MNKDCREAVEYAGKFIPLVKDVKDIEIVLCPSYTALCCLKDRLNGTDVKLGAQNMFYEESGAFTGEVSAKMLKSSGCDYVVLGHSERRHTFNEDDEVINKKIKTTLKNSLRVIFCVGETLEEREQNKTKEVIKKQIEGGLAGVDIGNVIVAYEPVWAIGTGKTASPETAEEVICFIRNILKERYNKESAEKIRILYGGSIKPENIRQIMGQNNIDGALVGGASLEPEVFSEIVKFKQQ